MNGKQKIRAERVVRSTPDVVDRINLIVLIDPPVLVFPNFHKLSWAVANLGNALCLARANVVVRCKITGEW